jgi:plastocyanin
MLLTGVQPNSINARPGDIVTFQFYPTNHSVIKVRHALQNDLCYTLNRPLTYLNLCRPHMASRAFHTRTWALVEKASTQAGNRWQKF